MRAKRFHIPDRELSLAGYAWEMGGSQALGLWFAQHRELCEGNYGALVRAVREYLQDYTDYSQDTPPATGGAGARGAAGGD